MALCACTSMQAMPLRAQPAPGDAQRPYASNWPLEVTLKTGATRQLQLVSADAAALSGTDPSDGAALSIPWEQVDRVERRERSYAKTAGLVVLGAAALYGVLLMLGAALTPSAAIVAAP
jgi:hypothetical protein